MTSLFQPMHLVLFLLGGILLIVLLLIVILLKIKRPAVPPPNLDLQARLEHLTALQQKALISDAEYQAKRRQLLDEL